MNHYETTSSHICPIQKSKHRPDHEHTPTPKPHLHARTPRTSRTALVPMGVAAPRRRAPAENQYLQLNVARSAIYLPIANF